MLKFLIVIFVIMLGIGFAVWDTYGPAIPMQQIDEQKPLAPKITFKTIGGKSVELHSLKGKTVLINVWATWCPPCIVELPQLFELADREAENIILIAISIDSKATDIEALLNGLPQKTQDRLNLKNIIIAHDPSKDITRDILGTKMYPESYIISPDMRMKQKIDGVIEWLTPETREMIFN